MELTPREREIASMLATGSTIEQVATDLNLNSDILRSYIYSISRKLHVHCRADLVRYFAPRLLGGALADRA